MRTCSLLFLIAGLIVMSTGCGKSPAVPPLFNKRTWTYTRYNSRAHNDDSGRIQYITMDTTIGNVVDEVHRLVHNSIGVKGYVYYMTADTGNTLNFEHIVYDSYEPIGYLTYYKKEDSITLKLIYGNYTDTTYRIYDSGEEYWHSGKSF